MLNVVNLFAIRATDPADMRAATDPVGEDNHQWVMRAIDATRDIYEPQNMGLVVCVWGTNGTYMDQDQTVLGWIEDNCKPMALGITKDGHPLHPHYVPYTAELVPFAGRRSRVNWIKLSIHRLEAGGFNRRLKARLYG